MGASRSSDANALDLLGDSGGQDLGGIWGGTAPVQAPDPTQANALKLKRDATATANINANQDRTSGTGAPLQSDVMGGATGAYEAGNDASRAGYDEMHDLGKGSGILSMKDVFNRVGEDVGVSHAGDVIDPGGFKITNPLDFNPIAPILDPNKGLGSNAVDAGRPLANGNPAAAIASQPILSTTGDALDKAMGGLTGPGMGDASGGDRGGMTGHTPYDPTLQAASQQGQNALGLGSDVLSGKTAAPNAADAQRQGDALDQAMGFMNGPRATQGALAGANAFQTGPKAANDVMGDLTAFTQAPAGPSQAEIQLQQQSGKNMADALSLARSGRARDAGSQARALNAAMAENAQTNAETNQQAALLRANEAATARGQNLQALGQKAGLAQGLDQNTLQALQLSGSLSQGLDQNTLQALGLTGDLANQMRNAGIQERGQGLNFMQGQEQIGAGLTGDVLKTIPQLEQVRHSDEFDLTPQQKMAQAGSQQKTALDYILGLGKDVLPLVG